MYAKHAGCMACGKANVQYCGNVLAGKILIEKLERIDTIMRYQFYKEETLGGEDATGKPMSRERFETPLYTLNKEHTVKNNLLAIGGNNSNKRKNNDHASTLPSISNSRQEKRKKKRREDEKWYKPRRDEERLAKTQKEGCINRDAKEERKKENGRPSPEAFSREGRQRVSRELKVSWTKPRDKTRELIWCLPNNRVHFVSPARGNNAARPGGGEGYREEGQREDSWAGGAVSPLL
ncbi:hypothetical protein WN51_12155 [Melipona quadrifasciata]|uniref:Uncharacterized protein n=1 Tax=Melipona quadrifasciata TaxID=166423 RepID=A0A0N1ITT2_9HYME|nr:hypothetical protein WN51_12155 [Melipona quadrifasciata]